MRTLQNKALHLAIHEQKLAVDAFANAMLSADPAYVASHDGELTTHMREAYMRFIIACRRLVDLHEKA